MQAGFVQVSGLEAIQYFLPFLPVLFFSNESPIPEFLQFLQLCRFVLSA